MDMHGNRTNKPNPIGQARMIHQVSTSVVENLKAADCRLGTSESLGKTAGRLQAQSTTLTRCSGQCERMQTFLSMERGNDFHLSH